MITWSPHPFLPHDEGRINGVVVARCGRTMADGDRAFMVTVRDGSGPYWGATAFDAKNTCDDALHGRVAALQDMRGAGV